MSFFYCENYISRTKEWAEKVILIEKNSRFAKEI